MSNSSNNIPEKVIQQIKKSLQINDEQNEITSPVIKVIQNIIGNNNGKNNENRTRNVRNVNKTRIGNPHINKGTPAKKRQGIISERIQDGVKMIQSIKSFHTYLFFFILFLFVIYYISDKISKDSKNCTIIDENRNMGSIQVNEFYDINELIQNKYFIGQIDIDGVNTSYDYKLKDFYIKTAYNCFCSGNFKNDFVNQCALQNCASFGVRALDMQIYSKNQTPIIGSSAVNSNIYKQSYNDITFATGLSSINDTYFINSNFKTTESETIQNNLKKDPLFLILRLYYGNSDNKSAFQDTESEREVKQLEFYNQIYNSLISTFATNQFASYHLQKKYGTSYDRTTNTPNMDMKDCANKVFIFVILNDTNYDTIKNSNLDQIVDLYGTDFNNYRINEIIDTNSEYDINKYQTQEQLSFCMPQLTSSSDNYDFTQAMKKGTQFVGMNFQTYDDFLNEYNNFFIEQYGTGSNQITSPYIKKPDHMIDIPIQITIK